MLRAFRPPGGSTHRPSRSQGARDPAGRDWVLQPSSCLQMKKQAQKAGVLPKHKHSGCPTGLVSPRTPPDSQAPTYRFRYMQAPTGMRAHVCTHFIWQTSHELGVGRNDAGGVITTPGIGMRTLRLRAGGLEAGLSQPRGWGLNLGPLCWVSDPPFSPPWPGQVSGERCWR